MDGWQEVLVILVEDLWVEQVGLIVVCLQVVLLGGEEGVVGMGVLVEQQYILYVMLEQCVEFLVEGVGDVLLVVVVQYGDVLFVQLGIVLWIVVW